MARDDEDDLYNEEFDFVDDDDDQDVDEPSSDDSDFEDERVGNERSATARSASDEVDEPVDEYGRPEPAANYVVHIYEVGKYRRTIDRPFTPEDAEAFATEYNRTAKAYHRQAVTSKNDAKPKKSLE